MEGGVGGGRRHPPAFGVRVRPAQEARGSGAAAARRLGAGVLGKSAVRRARVEAPPPPVTVLRLVGPWQGHRTCI